MGVPIVILLDFSSTPNFSPISAGMWVWGPKNKNFTDFFFKISECKRPAEMHLSRYFEKLAGLVGSFAVGNVSKLGGRSKGSGIISVWTSGGPGSPKFSAPFSSETIRRIAKHFRGGVRMCLRLSITTMQRVEPGRCGSPGAKNLDFFYSSVRHALERHTIDCERNFAQKTLE